MTAPDEPSTWSAAARRLTRTFFRDHPLEFGPDGYGMKNWDGRCGFIKVDDGLAGRIIIHVHDEDAEERFETIDNAIEAGWVVD